MILPPVAQDYDSSSQAILNDVLTKADEQNFKLDQDNFFTTGSICLQSANGKWWQITISDAGVLGTSELTTSDGRLDSDGNPVIASVNPYYVA
tara:strand:+ start:3059 stop:3337 length:279 start_codon:yes stop_codon:yes gene_type:complete